MARFKLIPDILSPLHSDISLNDISAFSFGSLTSTPENDKDFLSPIDKCSIEKDSDSFCKKTMNENEEVFEGIVKDFNRQSDINTKREEKIKESYKMLKQSMDQLAYTKTSDSLILSPISKDAEFENIAETWVTDSKLNLDKVNEDPKSVKVYKSAMSRPKTCSQISSKEIERTKKESSNSANKVQKSNLKNIQPMKSSANNPDAKLINSHKPKISKVTTLSTQTTKSFEAKGTTSKEIHAKKELQRSKPVKAFPFKSQQKITVSNTSPSIEDKNLSIEKSIQIAVGMEMDNLRSFIFDQNLSLNKELLKLQVMARKQAEVTGHLFSLVDELLEANKKLISKQK